MMRHWAIALGVILMMTEQVSADYLSDAPELISFSQQGWGQLGVDVAAHAPGQTPLPLRIGEKQYTKGLGHHAPGEIMVELNGEYDSFEAEVGVQANCAGGSVVFQVFVDDAQRFDSGVLKAGDPAKPVNIPTAGARELRLVVTDAGESPASPVDFSSAAELPHGFGPWRPRRLS